VVEQRPLKTADELEAECLRLFRRNVTTCEIQRMGILRLFADGGGPNWTCGELYPEPTPLGQRNAEEIVASVAERWALK
jgi:hypothetical protein